MNLLREYLRLLVETNATANAFVVQDPPDPPARDRQTPNFTITREFTLTLPGGAPTPGEHKIELVVDAYFRASTFKGSWTQPADDDEFEVTDWSPESVDGYSLSQGDSQRLYDFLNGELTEDEELEIMEMKRRESEDNYDPPDSYDDDPYR